MILKSRQNWIWFCLNRFVLTHHGLSLWLDNRWIHKVLPIFKSFQKHVIFLWYFRSNIPPVFKINFTMIIVARNIIFEFVQVILELLLFILHYFFNWGFLLVLLYSYSSSGKIIVMLIESMVAWMKNLYILFWIYNVLGQMTPVKFRGLYII